MPVLKFFELEMSNSWSSHKVSCVLRRMVPLDDTTGTTCNSSWQTCRWLEGASQEGVSP
jgi:hypothetical protein